MLIRQIALYFTNTPARHMVTSAKKRILVAPLDWGLGHATRCIPVIRSVLELGHEAVIAGSGTHAELLQNEFPGITTVPILSYGIRYTANPLLLKLKFPFLVYRVITCARQEHRQLAWIIDNYMIDAVISDQRFGCWSSRVPSAYISHQLCLKMPRGFGWLEPAFARVLRAAANRFHCTWIPDRPDEFNLTGDLAHRYKLPESSRFIGVLSRFSNLSFSEKPSRKPALLVMLSGPEPQRSLLEQIILSQLSSRDRDTVILRGLPAETPIPQTAPQVRIYNNLPGNEISGLMLAAEAIVCRGGYTTIMELVSLNKTAVLIPTPGQTEQIYLCQYLAARKRFVREDQVSFSLDVALKRLQRLDGFQAAGESNTTLLKDAIAALIG